VAAALLLAGTSVANARIRAAPGAHDNRNHGITETTSRPTAADPYYPGRMISTPDSTTKLNLQNGTRRIEINPASFLWGEPFVSGDSCVRASSRDQKVGEVPRTQYGELLSIKRSLSILGHEQSAV
jgi:hypothetical protein